MSVNYADRVVRGVQKKGTPCIVGLDPRIDWMPDFITRNAIEQYGGIDEAVRGCISKYHRLIIDRIASLVPAVKLQIAFYEQYGVGGFLALQDTVQYAKKNDLVVIIDAKRNDISSTAEAYANELLGKTSIFGTSRSVIDADSITVSPYLGRDSLEPFIDVCKLYGKGIFVLVKTSNPGSADFQDLHIESGEELFVAVAKQVDCWAKGVIGVEGYSSVGAVVGATFPIQAKKLRRLMPNAIFLVPGYGTQGAAGKDIIPCFNADGLGALVSASRSLTYGFESNINQSSLEDILTKRTVEMIVDVRTAIKSIS